MAPVVSLDLSNTGDQFIRVQIDNWTDKDGKAKAYDEYISAVTIVPVDLLLGRTYNLRLTKGRVVKRTNYTPMTDGATLEIDRYFA